MPNANDIRWFKEQFSSEIKAAIQGTPFSVDFLTALACQETGEIWPILRRKGLSRARILELCVGDTLDANKGRHAFPQTKADLVAKPNGQRMFDIARQGLLDMAEHITSYQAAASMPNKFCHGFGIFQYDLQFFLQEPDYFLEKRYADFNVCIRKALSELRSAAKKIGFADRTTLSDREMAFVAIAYNTGGFKASKGLKQGYRPPGGKFYGEQIFEFLELSKTVQVDGAPVEPPPEPATGPLYEVNITGSPLRLRSEPMIDADNANVKVRLPNGHVVRAVTNNQVNGFLEVETDVSGKHYRGFASAKYLKPA